MKDERKKRAIAFGLFAICLLVILFLSLATEGKGREISTERLIVLPVGKKFISAQWQGFNLWYLTRDMRKDEKPEAHEFIGEYIFGNRPPYLRIIFQERKKEE